MDNTTKEKRVFYQTEEMLYECFANKIKVPSSVKIKELIKDRKTEVLIVLGYEVESLISHIKTKQCFDLYKEYTKKMDFFHNYGILSEHDYNDLTEAIAFYRSKENIKKYCLNWSYSLLLMVFLSFLISIFLILMYYKQTNVLITLSKVLSMLPAVFIYIIVAVIPLGITGRLIWQMVKT